MAWFADLSSCTYFGEANASFLYSVGWLERGKSFSTGTVDSEVVTKLAEFIKNPVQPLIFAGCHHCDLCLPICKITSHKNVFIPASGLLFVCPEAIVHYIIAHSYKPPEEFCEAVLASPPIQSHRYLDALVANGFGRWVYRSY